MILLKKTRQLKLEKKIQEKKRKEEEEEKAKEKEKMKEKEIEIEKLKKYRSNYTRTGSLSQSEHRSNIGGYNKQKTIKDSELDHEELIVNDSVNNDTDNFNLFDESILNISEIFPHINLDTENDDMLNTNNYKMLKNAMINYPNSLLMITCKDFIKKGYKIYNKNNCKYKIERNSFKNIYYNWRKDSLAFTKYSSLLSGPTFPLSKQYTHFSFCPSK